MPSEARRNHKPTNQPTKLPETAEQTNNNEDNSKLPMKPAQHTHSFQNVEMKRVSSSRKSGNKCKCWALKEKYFMKRANNGKATKQHQNKL